jgi:hypothetical protein
MFVPILQSPTLSTNLVIRSRRDPRQAAAIKSTLRGLDRDLPAYIETWASNWTTSRYVLRMWRSYRWA